MMDMDTSGRCESCAHAHAITTVHTQADGREHLLCQYLWCAVTEHPVENADCCEHFIRRGNG